MEKVNDSNIVLTDNEVTAVTSLTKQNEVTHDSDASIMSGDKTAQSIEQFLTKPRLLLTDTITSTSVNTFSPGDMFLSITAVQHRTQFFKRLSGSLKVTFELTAPVYAVGMVMACVKFGHALSAYENPLELTTASDVIKKHADFTRTHVLMDVGTQTSASLTFPLTAVKPFIDISHPVDSTIFQTNVTYRSLTPIIDISTNTPTSVNMRVFVSIENPQVTVPVHTGTNASYTSKDSEVWETADGPISFPATIIANATRSMSKVPIIGKFAYATSLIASGIGKMAVLFGFSRPQAQSEIPYSHYEDYSSYAGNLRVKTYTLDPLQELPLNNIYTPPNGDSLTFENLINREGIVKSGISFSTSSAVQSQLVQIPVNPTYCAFSSYGGWAPTPLGHISILHTLWRGSLVYKLYVPANRFVRGKLRIAYIPQPNYAINYADLTQNALSVVLDLSQSSTVELSVPYTATETYLPVNAYNSDTIRQNYANNGFIAIFVEQALYIPAASGALTMFVTVRSGDDFELQVPTNNLIQQVIYIPQENAENNLEYQGLLYPSVDPVVYQLNPPSSQNERYALYSMQDNAFDPTLQTTVDLLPSVKTDQFSIYHMGEKFNSIRPLLKRFHPAQKIKLNSSYLGDYYGAVVATIRAFPLQNCAFFYNNFTTFKQNGYFMASPLAHVSTTFFGYKGSIRMMVQQLNTAIKEQESLVGTNNYSITLSRAIEKPNVVMRMEQIEDLTNSIGYDEVKYSQGAATYFTSLEPIITDFPSQTPQIMTFVEAYRWQNVEAPVHALRIDRIQSEDINFHANIMYSAGEDFNFQLWNGVPICNTLIMGPPEP